MSQRRRRGHGHTRGSCIIYSGGTTAVLPLSLVQQTSMEITRTDPHGFSTIVHRGFTTDTAVLLWIHTDLVQRAAANLLRTRERRARRLTERIVQEENFWVRLLAKEPKGDRAVGSALERRKAPEVRSTSVATICRMVVAY